MTSSNNENLQLDLTPMNGDWLYAMGMLWSRRTEAMSNRNNIDQVSRWLHQKSTTSTVGTKLKKFLIWNLSFVPSSLLVEDSLPFPLLPHHQSPPYDTDGLDRQVMFTPFPSRHSVPPFDYLFRLLHALKFSLSSSEFDCDETVSSAVHSIRIKTLVHCHNGKFKTSILISCLLRFMGVFESANQAFEYFIERRCHGDRSWISVSQKRFLHHFDDLMNLYDYSRKIARSPISAAGLTSPISLCNPSASIVLEKVVVNLGWNAENTFGLLQNSSTALSLGHKGLIMIGDTGAVEIEMHLEIYEKGRLLWASHSHTNSRSRSGNEKSFEFWRESVEFFPFIESEETVHVESSSIHLNGDLLFRLVLHTINIDTSSSNSTHHSTIKRTISKVTLASFYCHCAFLPQKSEIKVSAREMDVSGYGQSRFRQSINMGNGTSQLGTGSIPLGKIGASFFMILQLSSDGEGENPVPMENPTTNNFLALHKVILNSIPSVGGKCENFTPVLEIFRTITDDRGCPRRDCVYSTVQHRNTLSESVDMNQSTSSLNNNTFEESPPNLSIRSRQLSKDSSNSSLSAASKNRFSKSLAQEDPVFSDSYMAMFSLSLLGKPKNGHGILDVFDRLKINLAPETTEFAAMPMDEDSTYELKIFHIDELSGAKISIARYEFTPKLMASGLIRVRPVSNRGETEGVESDGLNPESPSGMELAELDETDNNAPKFNLDFSMDLVFAEHPLSDILLHVELSPTTQTANAEVEKDQLYKSLEYVNAFSKYPFCQALSSFGLFHNVRAELEVLRILCSQPTPPQFQSNYRPPQILRSLTELDFSIDLQIQNLLFEWRERTLFAPTERQTWNPLLVMYALQISNNEIHDAHMFLADFKPSVYLNLVEELLGIKFEKPQIFVEHTVLQSPIVSLRNSSLPILDRRPEEEDLKSENDEVEHMMSKISETVILPIKIPIHSRPVALVNPMTELPLARNMMKTQISIPAPPPMPGTEPTGAIPPPPPMPPAHINSQIPIPPPFPGLKPANAVSTAAVIPRKNVADIQSRKHSRVTLHWDALKPQDIAQLEDKTKNRMTIWTDGISFPLDNLNLKSNSKIDSLLNEPDISPAKSEGNLSKYDQWLSQVNDHLDLKKFESLFVVDPVAQKKIKKPASVDSLKTADAKKEKSVLEFNRARTIGIVLSRFERRFRREMDTWMKLGDENVAWNEYIHGKAAVGSKQKPSLLLDTHVGANMSRLWLFSLLRKALETGYFDFSEINIDEKRYLSTDELGSFLHVLPVESDLDVMRPLIQQEMKIWITRRSLEKGPTFDVHLASSIASPELFLYICGMTCPNAVVLVQTWLESKRLLGSESTTKIGELADVKSKLELIKATCQMLRNNGPLKVVMRTVLSLGNLNNIQYGRSSFSQDAVGFRIDSLPKLKDVRAHDGKTTLMNYLVEILWGIPEMHTLGEDMRVQLEKVGTFKSRDLLEQIIEAEKKVNELRNWKAKFITTNIEEATSWAPEMDGRAPDDELMWWTRRIQKSLSVTTKFENVFNELILPTADRISFGIQLAKSEWEKMWEVFYETSMYFGENPDEYDEPSTFSDTIGKSSSKRPENLFEIFALFFLYYNEAVQVAKRIKEREKRDKNRYSRPVQNS